MSFCPSCGTGLNDGATSCFACGTINSSAAGAATAVLPASTGMSVNGAAALAYLVGLVTGIIFLLIEPYKNDRFVRFHAFQSIFFHVAWVAFWMAWMLIGMMLSIITKGLFIFINIPIDLLLFLGGIGLWAYLMYSAYQGKTYRLPVIGALAAKQAGLGS
jgi:uncharacterized membrane protein